MKNDSVRGGRKISIPPTVLFSAIGKMDDVRRAVTMYFKKPGDLIFVVGETKDELGGSEFFRLLAKEQGNPSSYGGNVPGLDIERAVRTYEVMSTLSSQGLLRSSHTPTLGGLAVAFALSAVGGDLGAEIDLSFLPCGGALDDDRRLFSESNSRFIISCAPENEAALQSAFPGLPCARVGTVLPAPQLRVVGRSRRRLVDIDVESLRRAFRSTLYGV
jgi:phosphoribosylformylglycinamidine synthase